LRRADAPSRLRCDAAIIFDARTLSPLEIARKDEGGTHVTDSAGWSLLIERIEASGAPHSLPA
jgi:hypothetical protein